MKGTTYGERVVEIARAIPAGRVVTYGDICKAAGGAPMAAQGVSGILGRAYEKGITDIPWHRIVYANGKVWLSEAYAAERLRLYKKEGIALDSKNRIVNFEDIRGF
ncbi:hypothetical protein A3C89_01175 [Candidatus Kaiserbacteria bacterium RIFCSPHIGHO2_02_FULL_50_50]|uniref:Methylated-DNA-[protein]-cysteine S-methyltransferase DNA binding domain-containing protein n=1 Tax=Candidatus Kaiserbacteria bacterium RIFCSPHIGHO2_02_FULL_50_50 TaxID=1798492 RepID=A0A1F6DDR2_9BACT|nr:MAG: hypothetical protein A3C89_01175 [Candidatus Kaiserbacteria bacterium RIFCSPHIGHO2_02_FULL_50_50]OGG88734.1 MAG: hypothetical protein A3G62_00575 [Candidatus Kaiserbacteria bacterium RIFCSPLOWO2_12_FULL_50_10]